MSGTLGGRGEGVLSVVGTGRYIIGGDEEKGGRGSYRVRVGSGFGRRGFEWSKWVEWSGVEWCGRVNPPRMTTAGS